METQERPNPRRGVGRRNKERHNWYYRQVHFTKNLGKVKSWAVHLLAERLYEGKNTAEHRHAVRFWMRSGGWLKNA